MVVAALGQVAEAHYSVVEDRHKIRNSVTGSVSITTNPTNIAPIADAGEDQSVRVGDMINLDLRMWLMSVPG